MQRLRDETHDPFMRQNSSEVVDCCLVSTLSRVASGQRTDLVLPFPSGSVASLDGSTLVSGHLWHASILTALILLQALIVQCLLLLFWCHVGAVLLGTSRHARLLWRHRRDVFWRVGNITRVDTIFGASRLGCIQTGLQDPLLAEYQRYNGERTSYLNEVLAFWLSDKWL